MLVYDATCGHCVRFSRTIAHLGASSRLGFISIEDAEQAGLLDAIPRELRYSSFHLLDTPGNGASRRGGRRRGSSSGADAMLQLMTLLPLGSVSSTLSRRFPPFAKAVRFTYSALSRMHRACPAASRVGQQQSRAKLGAPP